MTTTSRNADIFIRDANGKTQAVVEVKNIQNLSRDKAMQLRRNLADFGIPFQAPFYLLLSQDVGFLKKSTPFPSHRIAAAPRASIPRWERQGLMRKT